MSIEKAFRATLECRASGQTLSVEADTLDKLQEYVIEHIADHGVRWATIDEVERYQNLRRLLDRKGARDDR